MRISSTPEQVGELAGELGLADPGGAGEQERADRLVHLAEAGAVALDGAGDAVDRRVLAEDPLAQLGGQIAQRLAPAAGDRGHRPPADARHHRGHLAAGDHVAPRRGGAGSACVACRRGVAGSVHALARRRGDIVPGATRAQLPARPRLVDHVDRLVGQAPVVDVDRRQLGGVTQCALAVTHLVERLVAFSQATQYQHGVIHPMVPSPRSSGSAATGRGPSRSGAGIPRRWWPLCSAARRCRAPA